MADKISRKELREPDAVLTITQKALSWIEQRKALLIGSLLVGVVVVVAVYGYGWFVESSTREASKAFMDAREILDARVVPNDDAAGTSLSDGTYASEDDKYRAAMASFELVRKNHSSAATATLAAFFIGECHSALGENEKAIESFQTYLDEAGASGELAPFAVEGIAVALEDSGQIDKAKQHYQRLLEDPFTTERARGLYHLARLEQKTGDKAEAARKFKALLKEFPNSAYMRDIQERLSVLPVVEDPPDNPAEPTEPKEPADAEKNG